MHQSQSQERAQSLDVPSRSDELLSTLTESAGGPLGRHTVPGRINPGFFTVERVLVMMAAVAALLAVMGKSHCRTVGWASPDQESTVCWSAFPNSFVDDKLGSLVPFFSKGSPFDDSVVAGWIAALTSWLTAPAGTGLLRQLAFFDVNAVLIALAWMLTVVTVARTARRRAWDAAMVAASPILLLTAYVSWDFWAVALVSLAMLFFTRRKTLLAGAALGLASLAAPYPFLVMAVLIILGIRTHRVSRMLEMAASGMIVFLLALAPLAAKNPAAYPDYLRALISREATESSLYGGYTLVAGRMGLPALDVGMANSLSTALLIILLVAVVYLGLYAPRRPRTAQLVFIAVAGFTVIDKGTEPWHAVWLLPLLALALPRWRPVLLWQAAVVANFIALMLFRSKELGKISSQHAIDTPYFVMASVLAGAATCVLIALVVRDIYVPRHDVVRRDGVEDPQGGIFMDAAPALDDDAREPVPDKSEEVAEKFASTEAEVN